MSFELEHWKYFICQLMKKWVEYPWKFYDDIFLGGELFNSKNGADLCTIFLPMADLRTISFHCNFCLLSLCVCMNEDFQDPL